MSLLHPNTFAAAEIWLCQGAGQPLIIAGEDIPLLFSFLAQIQSLSDGLHLLDSVA
jgi:hypothetical protein